MGQTRNPLYGQYTPKASTAVVICLMASVLTRLYVPRSPIQFRREAHL